MSPDGKRMVSAPALPGERGEVRVWDTGTGQVQLTLQGLMGGVSSVAFSPDGKRIVTAEAGQVRNPAEMKEAKVSGPQDLWKPGKVIVWDAETGQVQRTLQGPAGLSCVAFSPDGNRIALGGTQAVKVWDAETGQEIFSCHTNALFVISVAFSADGKRIVTGGSNGLVQVWDAETGQEDLSIKGHTSAVSSVAFSPEGKRIVTGGVSGTLFNRGPGELKVWDAETGQEKLTLKGHTAAVTSVAFSADGQRIISAGGDGTVRVWDAPPAEETAPAPPPAPSGGPARRGGHGP
jgi:WD40 repeat protein